MIGGNTTAEIQVRTSTHNEIGEAVLEWTTVQSIVGWLDLQGGDSRYTSFNTKMQESTHVFVADYVALDGAIRAEECRAVVNGARYDVMLIDDPMGLHKQLEIFLKYTGGQ